MRILPSPGIIDLINVLVKSGKTPDDAELASPWLRDGYYPRWFSDLSSSLTAICTWRQSLSEDKSLCFWVPDYFCNHNLSGVRAAGAKLVFFPINKNMNPDWDYCESIASVTPPTLFLLPHFLGIAGDMEGARKFCQRHKSLFIEDCSHVLLPVGPVGGYGDFVMYTPYELLPLPDGALLLAHPDIMKKVAGDSASFADSFEMAVTAHPQGSPKVWPWLLTLLFNRSFGAVAGLTMRQSALSRRLLKRYVPRLEAYGWGRCENAAIMLNAISTPKESVILRPVPGEGFPYLLGVRGPELPDVILRQAQITGCPALTWPDLSPEVLAKPVEHTEAIRLKQQTVLFPVCHGRSARRTMVQHLTGNVKSQRSNLNLCSLKWDISVDKWEQLFRLAPKSHLQQSRGYVEALRADRGWFPRYGVIEADGMVKAVFAVMEKRGPLGTAVARLNRGPEWLNERESDDVVASALLALSKHYSPKRGRLLFIAPNIVMSESTLVMPGACGFFRRMMRPWTSIWLDLCEDEQCLRNSLDGKWRNQLAKAERMGVQLEVSEDDLNFEWMVERHSELMDIRGFAGPSPRFVRHLRHNTLKTGEGFFVLRAIYDDQPVAGIAVVRHGTSATYLIGWNGSEGRKVNANNFLLWNALTLLKECGCQWFDLGGINERDNHGITAFKRGLQGQEYRLIGEYVNWGWLA